MTPVELSKRIDGVVKDLEGGAIEQIMVKLANDAIALIRQRVTQTGKNAEGIAFRDYKPGYKNYKMALGRYKGYVDFQFTGRMWANIKLFSSPDQHRKGIAKIAATTVEDQEKLEWNTGSRGPILELSQFEKELLWEVYNEQLLKIFRKNGL